MFFFAVGIALFYLKAIAREKFLYGYELNNFEKKLFKSYELENLDYEKKIYKLKKAIQENKSHEERTEESK